MKKGNLAIIGASYLQMPLIEKAKELGWTTHVFAWEAGDPGEEAADYFYPISIVDKEKILDECRKIGIQGICTIASDLAVITVNYVANELGLPGNSPHATLISTNKHEMRKAFLHHGVPSPQSRQILSADELDQSELEFPVIIKPEDRSGSRGIFKVEKAQDLENAIIQAQKESFSKHVLVEDYVSGQEYSAECISQNGVHHFLALTEKTTTGAPYFIETRHREPAQLSPEQYEKVKKFVFDVLNALELKEGASHTEFKIDKNGKMQVIEAAGRMGGDAIGSHLVYYSTGLDFVRMVIECATGEPVSFTKDHDGFSVESRFILTDKDLQIFKEMRKNSPERILEIMDYHPEKIGSTKDSSTRAGCYIIRN